MFENQGYYSLIQYSEYPERAEFINIGVVLFADVSPYVFFKFVEHPNRIERVFNSNPGVHFNNLKLSLQERLLNDFSLKWSRDSLEKFIDMRSGKIQMSSPRSIHVDIPSKTVSELFSELVGEIPKRASKMRAATRLTNIFKSKEVAELLDHPDPVRLPSGVEIRAPFAYQNGSYNLIKAIGLNGSAEEALKKASPDMIEGRLLSDATSVSGHKKLVVVGDVSNQSADFVSMLVEQMRNHDVRFYKLDDVGHLVSDIKKNVISVS